MKIAIVEDQKEYAQYLEGLLRRFEAEQGCSVQVSVFSDGMSFIENFTPGYDVILMDIEMPYMDGMTAARELRRIDEEVLLLFITNAPQYAIHGYEVGALDYVLKPVEYFALSLKLQRVQRILGSRNNDFLVLRKGDEINRLPRAEILYVEVQEHDVTYHTTARDYHSTGTLKGVEAELPGELFVKCNSCYLVNLKFVEGIADGHVQVGGQSLKISRPRKKVFVDALMEYYKKGGL